MERKHTLLGFILALVTGAALLAILAVNAFFPRIILPRLDAMAIIAVTLVSLVADCYVGRERKRSIWIIAIYGALIFGVFPLAAFCVTPMEALWLGIKGAVIVPVLTFLFYEAEERLARTPAAAVTPVISAFGLYLAAQCVIGIF